MNNNIKSFIAKHSSLVLMIFLIISLSILLGYKSEHFLTLKNLINILEANSYKLILAIGMTFIISSGAIDLSVGSIISLSAIIMALSMKNGASDPVGIIVALFSGAALGAFNGSIIHFSGINPMITTLATASIYRGLSLIITKGIPITKFEKSFLSIGSGELFGAEPSVTIAIIILVTAIPVMYKMKWGHYLRTMGSNHSALIRMGVSTGRYRISSYIYMGVMAAIVGIIITARLNSAEANAGLSMEMDAIAAVIMGGTPLHGGRAALGGTVAAVLLLGIIRNGLTVMSISSFYQQFITGTILLIAVLVTEYRIKKT